MDTTMILDSGNTAWIIVATLLVLLMTIPGIALEHYHAESADSRSGQYTLDSIRLQFCLWQQSDEYRQYLETFHRRFR